MVQKRSLACAITLALSLILLSAGPIFPLSDGTALTYTGEYSLLADGFFVIGLENHGFDVNASITVTYTYACEMGPEQHTSTASVSHGELGTIWVSIPISPPDSPEMCSGVPSLDAVVVDIISASPLPGQEANTAPTVEITTLFPLTGLAPHEVSAAGIGHDTDGTVAEWEWDFGDGAHYFGEGNTASVTHTYEQAGTYLVFLKIWDDRGAVAYAFGKVRVIAKDLTPSGGIHIDGTPVQYHELTFDASDLFIPTPTGTTYRWDFGDGTSGEGPLVSHEYGAPGTYAVGLTVSDGHATGMAQREASLVGDTPPVGIFAIEGELKKSSELTFDASGSYDPDGDELAFAWDFGDGGTAQGASVAYAYDMVGTYTVVLTVSDGTNTTTAISSVSVGNDGTNYLMYILPLLGVVAALILYTVKYGPKSTFEGLDLVRKDI